MNHKLPPVIRVFISSTFSDMERERSCFNEVISRKIRTVCAERGLSFFTVDLRWGITEEEQLSGRVLPICLNEIDKCRPFFIGILGNRYGSTLQAVSPEATVNIPWLKGMEGKSITEIEMLYAVLDKENSEISRDCAFYIRDEKLSEEWYGKEEKSTELELLINRVCSDEDLVCSHYSSVEEFAELVIRDIRSWLDKEFPCAENVAETRRDWYSGELKRGYINSSVNESFMNKYFRNSERSLVVFGKGSEGKTSFLNNWEPNGEKILINCGSDIAFSRHEEIAFEIIRQMKRIDPSIEVPEISEDITDERKRRRFI